MVDENEDGEKTSKVKKPGCLVYTTALGIAALVGGIYLMGRWDSLAGGAKGGAVVLVVLGTLMLLPVLIVVGIGIVMKVLVGKIGKGLSGAAQEMIAANKEMYGKVHEFRPADEEDFEDLNRAYYDDTRRELEGMGYRHLGDIVDETIEEQNGLVTPIRVMSSADGTVQVGLYHFKMPNLPAKFAGQEMLMCDLSTEFTDGMFLLTSNTQEADLTTTPPRLRKRRHPMGTPVTELLASHEGEKQKMLAPRDGVECVVVNILEDAIASEKRQQEAKNDFRKEIGFVDPEEVRRIAGGMEDLDPEVGEMTARAVDVERRKGETGRDE
jgi:hypothetical protein